MKIIPDKTTLRELKDDKFFADAISRAIQRPGWERARPLIEEITLAMEEYTAEHIDAELEEVQVLFEDRPEGIPFWVASAIEIRAMGVGFVDMLLGKVGMQDIFDRLTGDQPDSCENKR